MMQSFTSADLDRASRVYAAASDAPTRAVLDWFVDHPGERADGATIAAALGFPENRMVARATYTIGLAVAAEQRARPWSEGQLGYEMPDGQAALFAEARARVAANG